MSNSISDPTFAKQVKIERINFRKIEERPIYRRLTHIPTGTVIDGGPNEIAASLVKKLMVQLSPSETQ